MAPLCRSSAFLSTLRLHFIFLKKKKCPVCPVSMYQLPNFEEDLSPARCCKNRGGRLRWNNIPIALNGQLGFCRALWDESSPSYTPPFRAMKRKQGPASSSSQAKKTKPTLGTPAGTSSVLSSLQELLDFSQVKTEEDIEHRFNHIAKTLLHEVHLVVMVVKHEDTKDTKKEIEFEILEAEFYLQIGGCHEDPFTHGSEEQKLSGRWCVRFKCSTARGWWPFEGSYRGV